MSFFPFFFFNDTATTEIYTLSLHDALPISPRALARPPSPIPPVSSPARGHATTSRHLKERSEEHTSELQSLRHLVCRLLLEKKKKTKKKQPTTTHKAQVIQPYHVTTHYSLT